MNRDEGQYFLSHVFDDLLKTSRNTNNVSKQPSTSVHNRRSSLHNRLVLRKKTCPSVKRPQVSGNYRPDLKKIISRANIPLSITTLPNLTTTQQKTALHLCAEAGLEEPTRILLSSGANLSAQNIYGAYPLDVAIKNKHEGVSKVILSSQRLEDFFFNFEF